MPVSAARHGISPESLTRFDMSDEENVKQADFEFRRAGNDFELARWARTWGGASMSKLLAGPDRADVEDSDEYQSVDAALTLLESTAKSAVENLELVIERDDLPAGLEDQLSEIVAKIEAGLREAGQ